MRGVTIPETKEISQNWKKVRVEDIAESIQYGYTESSSKEKIGPKFLRITDIQNNSVEWTSVPYCKIDEDSKKKYLLKDGDLVFARTGATVGKSFLIKGQIQEAVFASYLIRLRFNRDVLDKYIWYYFQSLDYWKQITDGQVGIGQPNVNGTKLGKLLIPLPSLTEQNRIVSKIEELFSELDKSIEDLKTAQQQLKVYRQSVLKWAFEGRLLKKNSQNGSLPLGWSITQIGKICPRVTVGHVGPMKNEYIDQGVPFLRGQNVRANRFDSNGLKFISKEFHQKLSKSTIVPGDILVVRSGNVGTSCVVPETLTEANCSDLVIIKKPNNANSHWIAYYLNSVVESKVAAQKVGVALVHFNTKTVEKFTIPIPPIEEQEEILKEIESRFSVADKVEETIANSLEQAEALRQSVLKKAFEGRLTADY